MSEFIPVDGTIKGTTSLDTPTPDLSTREGCRDCHAGSILGLPIGDDGRRAVSYIILQRPILPLIRNVLFAQ